MAAMDGAAHSYSARSISRQHSQVLQRQEARASCSPSAASSLVRSSSLMRSSSISLLSPAHAAKDSRRQAAAFGDCRTVASGSSRREIPAAAKSPRRRSSKDPGPDARSSRIASGLSTPIPRSPVAAASATAAGEPVTCSSTDEPVAAPGVQDGVVVRDDLDQLLMCLPAHLREKLLTHPRRAELLEVVLDLGRKAEARFLGNGAGEYLEEREITHEDLEAAQESIGLFGGDNRAGVEGTLHRISCIRNRRGDVVGLTCRVGRAVTGHVDMVRDLLHSNNSLLFLGRPGVGKTTVIREIARVLSDELHKRVVIVDTSNEIGGDGDVPHPAIGGARRMQVPDPALQHRVMVEAVENHMPEVVIVDEIGTEAEALACRTIAERGVMLVGTAHGQLLENLIKNPTLCDLVGGVQTVTLGDEEARSRGTQKSVMERKAPPTFPVLLEMRERHFWVAHQTDKSVDALLHGKRPQVEVRMRDAEFKVTTEKRLYDRNGSAVSTGSGGFGRDDFDLAPAIAWSSGSSGNGVPLVTITSERGSREILQELGSLPALEDKDQTYMWAARLGHVPDKDAMADSSVASRRSNSSSSSNWSDFDEEYGTGGGGYMSGANGGKRGSKRGPRGVRPR